ncbi:MAG: UDP-N-acetylmuramoyl-tripeptide--D-alanyl-D-alanine ligase [Flavobacterium sp.]|jgi:UDP-N-acetylmuramoyl-tripeptide--D-alanyl-D-alanine ligase
MDIEKLYEAFLESSSVSTDTRKIEQDCIFFCLKGQNFDANTFSKAAVERGAKYVVIDDSDFEIEDKTILVSNVLTALQNLARHHRETLNLPILALTGSNGKTTTKELIHAVLSKKYRVKATVGNLNNHIGVPLTLLSFDKDTDIGIVEMGANHQKEIEFLCAIAKPNFGYITNFGKAHLEGFGGVEGVIKGKSEMYSYLKENQQKVFVNLDDDMQTQNSTYIDSVTFSIQFSNADVFIPNIYANPFVELSYGGFEIKTKMIGLYNATNIIASICVANYFSVPINDIQTALQEYTPENNRSQLLVKNENQIILDAYNANPSSMKLALENFNSLDGQNKICILGDMFELGTESKLEHELIVQQVTSYKFEKIFFIGMNFFNVKVESTKLNFFKNFDDFQKFLIVQEWVNKKFLIKGSRGIALERTLQYI